MNKNSSIYLLKNKMFPTLEIFEKIDSLNVLVFENISKEMYDSCPCEKVNISQ